MGTLSDLCEIFSAPHTLLLQNASQAGNGSKLHGFISRLKIANLTWDR